jgi:hypothetical protein
MNTSSCTAHSRINQGCTGTGQNQSAAQAKTKQFLFAAQHEKIDQRHECLEAERQQKSLRRTKSELTRRSPSSAPGAQTKDNSKPTREKSLLDPRPAHWTENRNEEHFRSEQKMNS